MDISVEQIVFWVLLIDSIGANIIAWFGTRWYKEHFRLLSHLFPATKAWTTIYLLLVLYIGYLVL